jgi:PEGA domain
VAALGAVAAMVLLARSASAERVIALAPLATLGAEDTSAPAVATVARLEKALAALPDTKVIGPAQVAQAIKRAKRPGLAICDGEPACLAELGQLTGATVVVTGQSGGLGEARVIYLSALEVATAKELGSTTWTTAGDDSAEAAVVRLLAPASYVGTLALAITVKGAAVYINGRSVGPSGTSSFSLPVGTHALRVTHPEFRDFVRFVDIRYAATTEVAVTLAPLPVVQRDLERHRSAATSTGQVPWFRRAWFIVGGAVALGVVAGVVGYYATDRFEPDVTLP